MRADLGYWCFFFQAEDGIRDLVRSRGLGDVYKRQAQPESELGGAVWLGSHTPSTEHTCPLAQSSVDWQLSLINT